MGSNSEHQPCIVLIEFVFGLKTQRSWVAIVDYC
jgi:hypothetical protein